MKFIFGLGNPGAKYKNNRHNIGYRVVEEIAQKDKSSFKRKFGLGGLISRCSGCCLIKPTIFMNNSGNCLKAARKKYGFSLENVLVIYDDVDLELGTIRLKRNGSSGGHRGMQSIIEKLATEEVNRLKVGIGRDVQIDTADYVLSDFSTKETEILPGIIDRAVSVCMDWLQ